MVEFMDCNRSRGDSASKFKKPEEKTRKKDQKKSQMKKVWISFLFLSTVTLSFAQISKDKLRSDFKHYITLTINQDFEKSFDYVVDDFFKVMPRAQMMALLKQMYNLPGIEYKVENPQILQIDDIEKINDQHYAILSYTTLLKMRVHPNDTNETNEDKQARIALLKASFGQKFGSKNVKYNEKTDFFEITALNKVCGVIRNEQAHWKFVTLRKGKTQILEQFIPKKILEKI